MKIDKYKFRLPTNPLFLDGSNKLSKGLIGYFMFNDVYRLADMASGIIVRNAVKNSKRIQNVTSGAGAKFFTTYGDFRVNGGIGLYFNSATGQLTIPESGFINLSPISVSCWYYHNGDGEGGNGNIIHKGNRWAFYTSTGGAIAWFRDYATTDLSVISNTGLLNTTRWNHVACVWPGGTTATDTKLYVNGLEVSGYATQTNGAGGLSSDSGITWRFGNNAADSNTLNGAISNFKIWNRTLTSKEIKTDFDHPFGLLYKRPDRRLIFPITVSSSQSSTATPNLAVASLIVNQPTVQINASSTVTASKADITLNAFSPTIIISQNSVCSVTQAVSSLSVYSPTINISGSQVVSPQTCISSLNIYQPTVSVSSGQTSSVFSVIKRYGYSNQINWSNNVSKDLVGCYISRGVGKSSIKNIALDSDDLLLKNTAQFSSRYGKSLITSGNDDEAYDVISNNQLKPSKKVTVLWRGVILGDGSISGNPYLFGCYYDTGDNSPYACWGIVRKNSGQSNISGFFNNGSLQEVSSTGTINYGKIQTYVLTLNGDSGRAILYKDGIVIGVSSLAGTIQYSSTSTIGFNIHPSALYNTNAANHAGFVWKRELSQNEVRIISSNPYSILYRAKRTFIFKNIADTGSQSSLVLPLTSYVDFKINQPTVSVSGSQSSTVTPNVAISSVTVSSPTTTFYSNNLSTPQTAVNNLIVNQPTVQINASQTVTPALSTVTVLVNQPTVSSGGSQSSTTNPGISTVSFQVNSPNVVITSSTVCTPGSVLTKIIINQPTVITGSGTVATPNLAISNLVVNSPTTSVVGNRIVNPTRADIQVLIFEPTTTSGVTSNITIYIVAKSKIEKTINANSQIDKTILNDSRIEKYLTLKSGI